MNEVMLAVTVLNQRSVITDTKTKGNESHHGDGLIVCTEVSSPVVPVGIPVKIFLEYLPVLSGSAVLASPPQR